MTPPDLLIAQTIAEVRGPWDEPWCIADALARCVPAPPMSAAVRAYLAGLELMAAEISRVIAGHRLPI